MITLALIVLAVIALVVVVLVQGKWTRVDSWFAAVFASVRHIKGEAQAIFCRRGRRPPAVTSLPVSKSLHTVLRWPQS
jgi:hypothetical protein